jgi:predicted PurR-regulated permease PerM
MPLDAHRRDDRSIPAPEAPATVAPLDVRSVSLAALAVIAVIFTLHWAKEVLIPIALAVFLSYLLAPSVSWLRRRVRLPAMLAAALAVAVVAGGIAAGAAALRPQALELLDLLPKAARKVQGELRRSVRDKDSAIAKVKEAAAEIERAASTAAGAASPRGATARKSPAEPPLRVEQYFAIGTASAIAGVAYAVIVVSLVYLLLVAGDTFKRKLVRVSGETWHEKKITVEILDEVDRQIQRYLLIHVATSALLGVLSWAAFALIGLDNAPFWAVAAAVLHLIPYVGSALTIAATGVVAYLQFGDLASVALIVGSQLVIAYGVGLLLMPWCTERIGRINAVMVFISLLFWGWLWGVWGLLLGVPIMMAVKAVCERVEGLQPIAEFLGNEPAKPKPAAPA